MSIVNDTKIYHSNFRHMPLDHGTLKIGVEIAVIHWSILRYLIRMPPLEIHATYNFYSVLISLIISDKVARVSYQRNVIRYSVAT